jgi:hypothetical protein
MMFSSIFAKTHTAHEFCSSSKLPTPNRTENLDLQLLEV